MCIRDRDYTVRKVFTLEDLAALPQTQQAYTFVDSMPSVVLCSAVGVKLTDLLEAAGIDVNSVETFYFYCVDVNGTWYESLPKSYLLDTKRYYYPNLPTHWDSQLMTSAAGALAGRVEVAPMLAVKDYWKRFGTEPEFDKATEEARFRLVFGQTDGQTSNAYRSAKWVHGIDVLLGGTPQGEVGEGELDPDQKVGSLLEREREGGVLVEIGDKKQEEPEGEAEKRKGKEAPNPDAGLQRWRVYEMSDDAVAPVSYTHLDVYKRQVSGCGPGTAHWHGSRAWGTNGGGQDRSSQTRGNHILLCNK